MGYPSIFKMTNYLSQYHEITGQVDGCSKLTGGFINEVFYIRSKKGNFVLKYNKNANTDMFHYEKLGLNQLKKAKVPVPQILGCNGSSILLEFLPVNAKVSINDYERAGQHLAKLHSVSSDHFGLSYNNYIGHLQQVNEKTKSWINFFWKYRIENQLQEIKTFISIDDEKIWQKLKNRLPSILDHDPTPALIHGDLWRGNIIWSDGGPQFIDPAIYYSDPMLELAFSELYASFHPHFLAAYSEIIPLSKKYSEIKKLYQIVPLLTNANLYKDKIYYLLALHYAKQYC